MDGFVAQPAAIRAVAANFESLADKADYIRDAASNWMHVPHDSSVLSDIASEVEQIREALLDSYGSTGDYRRMMEGVAETLRSIARDYETTDREVARRADGLMKEIDRPATASFASPGIDEEEYATRFKEGPSGSFDDYDQFLTISKSINYMLEFKWVGSALEKLGIPDPLKKLKFQLSGDWAKVGDALGAVEMTVNTLTDIIWDLDGIIESLDGKWEGNASNSAREYFKKVRHVVDDSGSGIGAYRERMTAESLAYKAQVEVMNDMFELVVDAIPQPTSLADLLTTAMNTVTPKALTSLLANVMAFKLAFDVALGAAQQLVAGFSQLARFQQDLRFPEVPQWAAPDVNGVA
ncbi:hypothetical protein FB381_1363 [Nocardioides albertanoniae]|uniref:Uncharacterized protein n=1 Tax=Nocardioides albertanoniae TaxID=1175486 RepID=A0A543A4T0_9ACTN|nr:hypothetical protein [Nocardioides albertanoniae]TQL67486.1 hypothetical protein FB381_1363 [Nocardioides albertanoniae]